MAGGCEVGCFFRRLGCEEFGVFRFDIYCRSLEGGHRLLKPLVQFLLQFLLGPQRQRLLGTALLDVLTHQPAERFQQSVSGGTAGRGIVILLDEHGRKSAHATEILHHPLKHLGRVGDVASPGGHRGKEHVSPGLLDPPQGFAPLLPLLFLVPLLAGLPADEAIAGKETLAVLDPPAEMLLVEGV